MLSPGLRLLSFGIYSNLFKGSSSNLIADSGVAIVGFDCAAVVCFAIGMVDSARRNTIYLFSR